VLDEVDRMLDMGFAEDVDSILNHRYSGDYTLSPWYRSACVAWLAEVEDFIGPSFNIVLESISQSISKF